MPYSGSSAMHGVNPNLKKCFSLEKLAGKKSLNMPYHEQGHFGRNLSLQFHILHSMRPHSYLKTIWGWSYTCFRVFDVLPWFGKISSQCPDLYNFPVLIFSAFKAFNYYSIMESMSYFGEVVHEILENNQMKSYFGVLEIEFLSPFLEVS